MLRVAFTSLWLGLAQPVAAAPDPAEPEVASTAEMPVAVTTRVQPDPSYVGDVLRYEVVAAYPRGVSVNLPSNVTLAPLHLVRIEESEPEVTGEGLRKTFVLELQHFATGEGRVPGFPLTYVMADGSVQTLDVPPQGFTVDALLANEAEPARKPEDPPISVSYPNELAETVLYSAGGTLLAVLLLLPLLLRWLRRERVVAPPPPIPAHERAFAALDALEQGPLLADGRYQAFYVQLTEVAKEYLEGRFGMPALDHTTDEIRRALMRKPERVAPLKADDVIAFLQRCDLVKFARFEPRREEAATALSSVRGMVDESKTVAAPAASEEPKPEQRAS